MLEFFLGVHLTYPATTVGLRFTYASSDEPVHYLDTLALCYVFSIKRLLILAGSRPRPSDGISSPRFGEEYPILYFLNKIKCKYLITMYFSSLATRQSLLVWLFIIRLPLSALNYSTGVKQSL